MPAAATIGEVMTRAPQTIDCRASVAEARELLAARDVHRLPVTDRGKLVGIVSAGDLDRLQAAKPNVDVEVLSVGEAASEPYVVAADAPLAAVVRRMVDLRVDHALVAGDAGVAGLFTRHDAMRILASLLAG